MNKEEVTEEWLSSQALTEHSRTLIFERSNSNDGKPDLRGIDPQDFQTNIIVSLQKETLILSLGAKLKVELLSKIYNWFGNIIFLNFGNPSESFFLSQTMPHDFQSNPNVREDVTDYLG